MTAFVICILPIASFSFGELKPFIRHPTPAWKSVPHPSGIRLPQLDSPSGQPLICGSQIKKAADEKDKIGLCLSNAVKESNVMLSEEPNQVRIPFIGFHQRAIFMHPTNKWLSPFKTGPALPALQGIGKHQFKEAGFAIHPSTGVVMTKCLSLSLQIYAIQLGYPKVHNQ